MLPGIARVDRPELMDTTAVSTNLMQGALDFLALTNRRFGGISTILSHLSEWASAWNTERPIHILDVGTGSGEIPIAIAAWARRAGRAVRVTAVDLVPQIVEIAKRNAAPWDEIEIRQDDFFAMERNHERFDYAIASLFLHHVRPTQALDALHTFDRIATRGVILSDLLRSPTSLAAIGFLSYAIGNSVVRHDGPLSVRRGFLPSELSALAESAGLSYLRARREPWFRVSLAGEKARGA
jgi:2-polyprenyl-3-methyl-5-hydroxy-6-metoxy-1,4-benzoquinol methylase